MAKYMLQVSYTAEGARGLMKEGATARREYISGYIASLGGTLEAFYFCFGEHDAVVIADLPGNTQAAAASLAVSASGSATTITHVLLPPEEIDAASGSMGGFRAAGT